MNLRDVVLTQQSELGTLERQSYIDRRLTRNIADDTDLIRVIVGPRRAGKSTLAIHLLRELGGGGYINFDDERLAMLENADPLLAAIDEVYKCPRFLLFDEIQNFSRWELLVNRLQRQGRRLLLTGSNANLLAGELATHLTGRYQRIDLLPFSFAERISVKIKNQITSAESKAALESYLQEGGYPEPLLRGANRVEYLRDLIRATLHKDVVRRHRIRAAGGLEDIAHYFFSNVAKEFSYRTVASIARVTSVTTAEKYTRFLAEAYLLFTLNRLTFKARERAAVNKKVYAIDPALAVCFGTRPGSDIGCLAENVVAIALWRKQLAGESEIYFWQSKEHEEVDFVIREKGRVVQLIQVCWDLSNPFTQKREYRSLAKASKELRCDNLLCLTFGNSFVEHFVHQDKTIEINIISIDKWLIDQG